MSKSYEITGTIHSIKATQTFDSGFQKREFVLLLTGEDENPDYPNHVPFNVIKDKCDSLNGYTVGQSVQVKFNLGGRLWQSPAKGELCFSDLQAWKIEALSAAPAQQPKTQTVDSAGPFDNADAGGSDLPF